MINLDVGATGSVLPALERAEEFVKTHEINFLISPDMFQGEVFVAQFISLMMLVYITVKVARIP